MDDLNTPADLDPVLLDLLVEYDERATAGEPVTPEAVCRDHPDRLAEFRKHLGWVARARARLAPPGPAAGPPDIPGYELLGELGRGGMGVVYRARDVALDCPVAVKVPHPEAAGGVSRDRFAREARTLARLRHPGIVPVRAADFTGGRPYFVMDLVPGGSLADRRAAGPVPAAAAAALLEPIARAVHHAHGQGVVHRDLKPSNVLVDADGRPRVGDFGVAALFGAAPDPGADAPRLGGRLTLTGRLVGTPAYVAPELHPGAGGRASPASDVWSLGVILYELLTGRLPFGPDPVGDPPADWTVWWPREVPVDAGLRAVVRKCLAADPAGRYASAAALADALAGWQRGQRLRRWRWAGLAAAVVVAVGGAAVWLRPPPPPTGGLTRLYDAPERLARGEAVPLSLDPTDRNAFDIRADNPAEVWVGAGPDGELVVDSGPDRPALVELLDRTGTGRYRFTVEVRQDEGVGRFAHVGLFFARQELATTNGRAHLFGRVRFADLGPGDEADADITHLCLIPPYTRLRNWPLQSGPSARYTRPGSPAPWRCLSVTVDRGEARATFDGRPGGPEFPPHELEYVGPWVEDLPRQFPEMAAVVAANLDATAGGLGLFLYSTRASFRNARVEPLDP